MSVSRISTSSHEILSDTEARPLLQDSYQVQTTLTPPKNLQPDWSTVPYQKACTVIVSVDDSSTSPYQPTTQPVPNKCGRSPYTILTQFHSAAGFAKLANAFMRYFLHNKHLPRRSASLTISSAENIVRKRESSSRSAHCLTTDNCLSDKDNPDTRRRISTFTTSSPPSKKDTAELHNESECNSPGHIELIRSDFRDNLSKRQSVHHQSCDIETSALRQRHELYSTSQFNEHIINNSTHLEQGPNIQSLEPAPSYYETQVCQNEIFEICSDNPNVVTSFCDTPVTRAGLILDSVKPSREELPATASRNVYFESPPGSCLPPQYSDNKSSTHHSKIVNDREATHNYSQHGRKPTFHQISDDSSLYDMSFFIAKSEEVSQNEALDSFQNTMEMDRISEPTFERVSWNDPLPKFSTAASNEAADSLSINCNQPIVRRLGRDGYQIRRDDSICAFEERFPAMTDDIFPWDLPCNRLSNPAIIATEKMIYRSTIPPVNAGMGPSKSKADLGFTQVMEQKSPSYVPVPYVADPTSLPPYHHLPLTRDQPEIHYSPHPANVVATDIFLGKIPPGTNTTSFNKFRNVTYKEGINKREEIVQKDPVHSLENKAVQTNTELDSFFINHTPPNDFCCAKKKTYRHVYSPKTNFNRKETKCTLRSNIKSHSHKSFGFSRKDRSSDSSSMINDFTEREPGAYENTQEEYFESDEDMPQQPLENVTTQSSFQKPNAIGIHEPQSKQYRESFYPSTSSRGHTFHKNKLISENNLAVGDVSSDIPSPSTYVKPSIEIHEPQSEQSRESFCTFSDSRNHTFNKNKVASENNLVVRAALSGSQSPKLLVKPSNKKHGSLDCHESFTENSICDKKELECNQEIYSQGKCIISARSSSDEYVLPFVLGTRYSETEVRNDGFNEETGNASWLTESIKESEQFKKAETILKENERAKGDIAIENKITPEVSVNTTETHDVKSRNKNEGQCNNVIPDSPLMEELEELDNLNNTESEVINIFSVDSKQEQDRVNEHPLEETGCTFHRHRMEDPCNMTNFWTPNSLRLVYRYPTPSLLENWIELGPKPLCWDCEYSYRRMHLDELLNTRCQHELEIPCTPSTDKESIAVSNKAPKVNTAPHSLRDDEDNNTDDDGDAAEDDDDDDGDNDGESEQIMKTESTLKDNERAKGDNTIENTTTPEESVNITETQDKEIQLGFDKKLLITIRDMGIAHRENSDDDGSDEYHDALSTSMIQGRSKGQLSANRPEQIANRSRTNLSSSSMLCTSISDSNFKTIDTSTESTGRKSSRNSVDEGACRNITSYDQNTYAMESKNAFFDQDTLLKNPKADPCPVDVKIKRTDMQSPRERYKPSSKGKKKAVVNLEEDRLIFSPASGVKKAFDGKIKDVSPELQPSRGITEKLEETDETKHMDSHFRGIRQSQTKRKSKRGSSDICNMKPDKDKDRCNDEPKVACHHGDSSEIQTKCHNKLNEENLELGSSLPSNVKLPDVKEEKNVYDDFPYVKKDQAICGTRSLSHSNQTKEGISCTFFGRRSESIKRAHSSERGLCSRSTITFSKRGRRDGNLIHERPSLSSFVNSENSSPSKTCSKGQTATDKPLIGKKVVPQRSRIFDNGGRLESLASNSIGKSQGMKWKESLIFQPSEKTMGLNQSNQSVSPKISRAYAKKVLLHTDEYRTQVTNAHASKSPQKDRRRYQLSREEVKYLMKNATKQNYAQRNGKGNDTKPSASHLSKDEIYYDVNDH